MKEYAFFPGCSIPSGFPVYERLVLEILRRLGIEVRYPKGLTCCPAPMSVDLFNETACYAISARNLSIVEDMGLDLLTPCNGCTMSLSRANRALRSSDETRAQVNSLLSTIGRSYQGTVEVRSLLRLLYEEVGPSRIQNMVVKPLKGLKVAVHYGCHAFEELAEFNDPRNPTALEELCRALGADVVEYPSKNSCCLVFANPVDRDTALDAVRAKVRDVSRSGADCMVVICASCFSQFDRTQEMMAWIDWIQESAMVPVFLYPELLGLAMGMTRSEVGIAEHSVDAGALLDCLDV